MITVRYVQIHVNSTVVQIGTSASRKLAERQAPKAAIPWVVGSPLTSGSERHLIRPLEPQHFPGFRGRGDLERSSARILRILATELAHAILTQARKLRAELIVLGTHGRRGLARLVMGSDAEAVVREARVPVLLERSPMAPHASRSAKNPTETRGRKTQARRATSAQAQPPRSNRRRVPAPPRTGLGAAMARNAARESPSDSGLPLLGLSGAYVRWWSNLGQTWWTRNAGPPAIEAVRRDRFATSVHRPHS